MAPIYEYRCKNDKCELEFDSFLNIQDSDIKKQCPVCDTEAQKLISGFSFVNKGSEHRDIDCIVGEDAERKWENIHKRKTKRDKQRAKEQK